MKTGENSRIRHAGWGWPHQFWAFVSCRPVRDDIIAWYHIIWPCSTAVFTLTQRNEPLCKRWERTAWAVSQCSVTSLLMSTTDVWPPVGEQRERLFHLNIYWVWKCRDACFDSVLKWSLTGAASVLQLFVDVCCRINHFYRGFICNTNCKALWDREYLEINCWNSTLAAGDSMG